MIGSLNRTLDSKKTGKKWRKMFHLLSTSEKAAHIRENCTPVYAIFQWNISSDNSTTPTRPQKGLSLPRTCFYTILNITSSYISFSPYSWCSSTLSPITCIQNFLWFCFTPQPVCLTLIRPICHHSHGFFFTWGWFCELSSCCLSGTNLCPLCDSPTGHLRLNLHLS